LLDGERALKPKLASALTQGKLGETEGGLVKDRTELWICDPVKEVGAFAGRIDNTVLSSNQFIPRGSTIQHAKDVYAVVAFTGEETKLMLN
jgi:magnesium-transporting ATPase (P-type)